MTQENSNSEDWVIVVPAEGNTWRLAINPALMYACLPEGMAEEKLGLPESVSIGGSEPLASEEFARNMARRFNLFFVAMEQDYVEAEMGGEYSRSDIVHYSKPQEWLETHSEDVYSDVLRRTEKKICFNLTPPFSDLDSLGFPHGVVIGALEFSPLKNTRASKEKGSKGLQACINYMICSMRIMNDMDSMLGPAL